MSDHPMPFSPAMVRALLEGRKTQTRRVLKPQPTSAVRAYPIAPDGTTWNILAADNAVVGQVKRPVPGDRLWVRENWYGIFWSVDDLDRPPREHWDTPRAERVKDYASAAYYEATEEAKSPEVRFYPEQQWAPSIHMPRWASRITLIVTDVRVQRVQEIIEADAIAEGVELDSDGWFDYQMPNTQCCPNARDSYRTLWDSLNAKRGFGWDANPWVVALTFTVEQRNIDA